MQNDILNTWSTSFSQITGSMMQSLFMFLPKLISAVAIFLFGMIASDWAKSIIAKSLRVLKVENITKDKKVKKFLAEAEISHKLDELVGIFVKWIILAVFFITSLNVLGLTAVSNLLYSVIAYIPNVISAIIVLAVGVLLAGLMESIVKGALASVDIKTSRLMGRITSYIIVTITLLVSISELNIAQDFINILFIGFVGMISIGLGLAIGLGSKDLVSKILNDWYKTLQKDLKPKK